MYNIWRLRHAHALKSPDRAPRSSNMPNSHGVLASSEIALTKRTQIKLSYQNHIYDKPWTEPVRTGEMYGLIRIFYCCWRLTNGRNVMFQWNNWPFNKQYRFEYKSIAWLSRSNFPVGIRVPTTFVVLLILFLYCNFSVVRHEKIPTERVARTTQSVPGP